VVARKAGVHPHKIVLCAHYDTKVDTPGASDNGGGVAVLLALAERLSRAELSCGLEFVAFTGEEYLPIGDDEYLRRGEAQLGQILAAINFDGAGTLLSPNTITLISASQAFQEHLTRLTRSYPGLVWVEPWPQSNHSTFSWRGVPSIAFSSADAFRLAHQRTDRVEWMSADRLDELVALGVEIVESLQDKPVDWGREGRGVDSSQWSVFSKSGPAEG
jgi:Zn-dependent M28 family amino/carboxypeptidase